MFKLLILSVLLLLTLMSTPAFAQITPWNLQKDLSDNNKVKLWYTSLGTPALTVTTDGKLGIGTANPNYKLDVRPEGGSQTQTIADNPINLTSF